MQAVEEGAMDVNNVDNAIRRTSPKAGRCRSETGHIDVSVFTKVRFCFGTYGRARTNSGSRQVR